MRWPGRVAQSFFRGGEGLCSMASPLSATRSNCSCCDRRTAELVSWKSRTSLPRSRPTLRRRPLSKFKSDDAPPACSSMNKAGSPRLSILQKTGGITKDSRVNALPAASHQSASKQMPERSHTDERSWALAVYDCRTSCGRPQPAFDLPSQLTTPSSVMRAKPRDHKVIQSCSSSPGSQTNSVQGKKKLGLADFAWNENTERLQSGGSGQAAVRRTLQEHDRWCCIRGSHNRSGAALLRPMVG